MIKRVIETLGEIERAASSNGWRQDAEIEKEGTRAFEAGEALKMWKQDAQDKGQELLKVRAWHEEKLQRIRELEAERVSLMAGKALDEANKKYDESHKLHVWAVKEQNSAQEEVRKLSAELAKETRRLREYEDDYAQIYSLAAAAGMQGNESVKQCLERKLAELSTITADRDRIRAELAAILAEANKSGRCSGDPVALIRQGQNDLDARIAAEREAEDIKKRWRALNEHASLKGMYGNETTAAFITRQYRLAVERQEGLDRASETIRRLTSDLENAIVDKVLAGNGAKEVARLSELVASLQVELDEAKSKYSGIMAQLGNETPLQLIERMQMICTAQKAELVAEVADLKQQLVGVRSAYSKTHSDLICMERMANERGAKLDAALKTVESQSAAIAEAKQATEKYTEVVQTAAKLRDWAFTIRHKVLVKLVHDKAMIEYDTIMKELDGKAGTDGR